MRDKILTDKEWENAAEDVPRLTGDYALLKADRQALRELVATLADLLEHTPKLMSIDVGMSWQNHIAQLLARAKAVK